MNKKIFLFLVSIFIINCSNNAQTINSSQFNFDTIFFDVVEKQIILNEKIPQHSKELFNYWFNEKVKINGFTGKLILNITDYNEKISEIPDGKRFDANLNFLIELKKGSKEDTFTGQVNSYGSVTGDFSLNDFDRIVKNAQNDLVVRFAEKLNSYF